MTHRDPVSQTTREPWLFTPSEVMGGFWWGVLTGALSTSCFWIGVGLHLSRIASQ